MGNLRQKINRKFNPEKAENMNLMNLAIWMQKSYHPLRVKSDVDVSAEEFNLFDRIKKEANERTQKPIQDKTALLILRCIN